MKCKPKRVGIIKKKVFEKKFLKKSKFSIDKCQQIAYNI